LKLYADTIDWSAARVQEKVDGSLIKVWYYNGEWNPYYFAKKLYCRDCNC